MRGLLAALFLVAACTTGTPGPSTPAPNQASPTPAPTLAPSVAPQSPTLSPATPSPVAAIAAIEELRSQVARNPVGADRLAGVDAVAASDADFAFRLYQDLVAAADGNLFISPYSISTALSMLLGGTDGNTFDEIAQVLTVDGAEQDWHDARNRLELALASEEGRIQVREGEEATALTLDVTNAVFGQANYAFRDAYLDLLAADYGAGMQAVDFVGNTEAARRGINRWVAERTRDRIEELLKEGSITPLVRAVLVNATYFKAGWRDDFDPDGTTPAPFQLLDGSATDVDMMHGRARTGYATGPGWAAVRLVYWGGASMIVILPDEGSFATVERGLDAAFASDVIGRLYEFGSVHDVDLKLPRWESESALDLIPALQRLGINDAFDPLRADLSRTADFSLTGEQLYVGGVVHQANITVDEEGTEAAAATAVIEIGVSRCCEPATFVADRPFVYLIRDDVTGEILFLGRLLEP